MLVAFETVAVFAKPKTSPPTEWPRFSQAAIQLLHCSLWLLELKKIEDTKRDTKKSRTMDDDDAKYVEL